MVRIMYADVHSPVFLNGRNLSQKLDPKKFPGLILSYDLKTQRLWIEYKGMACFFGIEGAIHPADPSEFGYKLIGKTVKPDATPFQSAPMTTQAPRTAQVETPMGKVQQPPQPRAAK